MHFQPLLIFACLVLVISSPAQGSLVEDGLHEKSSKALSPFEIALKSVEKLIGYTFKENDLLRRAMTHPSYSRENNKALSMVGGLVIETWVALRSLKKNIDISPDALSPRMIDASKVESCAADAVRFGLEKVIRVSSKTNASIPSVVCGGFRAMFGAIALDCDDTDAAGTIFWNAHHAPGIVLDAHTKSTKQWQHLHGYGALWTFHDPYTAFCEFHKALWYSSQSVLWVSRTV